MKFQELQTSILIATGLFAGKAAWEIIELGGSFSSLALIYVASFAYGALAIRGMANRENRLDRPDTQFGVIEANGNLRLATKAEAEEAANANDSIVFALTPTHTYAKNGWERIWIPVTKTASVIGGQSTNRG